MKGLEWVHAVKKEHRRLTLEARKYERYARDVVTPSLQKQHRATAEWFRERAKEKEREAIESWNS